VGSYTRSATARVGYNPTVITAVTADPTYRELAEQALRGACDGVHIELASVEFGERHHDAAYSWLCFVVDPGSDDHAARNSMSTATDHFALIDPNGSLREAGSRLAPRVYKVEVAGEASLTVRGDDGLPRLISPWEGNLAVARVGFTYCPA
jgi:hypothetical protein